MQRRVVENILKHSNAGGSRCFDSYRRELLNNLSAFRTSLSIHTIDDVLHILIEINAGLCESFISIKNSSYSSHFVLLLHTTMTTAKSPLISRHHRNAAAEKWHTQKGTKMRVKEHQRVSAKWSLKPFSFSAPCHSNVIINCTKIWKIRFKFPQDIVMVKHTSAIILIMMNFN